MKRFAFLAAALLFVGPIPSVARAPSPALIEAVQLNQRLLAATSATVTLRAWCAEHGVPDPTIHADLVKAAPPAATATQRRELRVGAAEPLGYRHVRLSCAGHVLSDAQNWYVPARLTPAMNLALDTSDTPFGTVVAPLRIARRTLAAQMLWRHGATPPAELFRHRALVLDATGRPIAEVIETYQRAAVALR
jgi:chorismate-pyruvate lyase